MKKILLYLTILLIFVSGVFADETLNKLILIEKEIKSYGGENISIEKRVENAELNIFGEKKSGTINTRIDNLSTTLGLSTQNNEESKYEIEDDKLANYPVIDQLEEKIFNHTYNENIYKRLERLEKKTENKVFDDKPLNERVSYLKEKYLLKENNDAIEQDFEYNNNYHYYSPKTYQKSNIQKSKGKSVYKQFDNNDEQSQKEKIDAIKKAKQTQHEYKVNKFAKYAATAIQLGGIALLILAIVL